MCITDRRSRWSRSGSNALFRTSSEPSTRSATSKDNTKEDGHKQAGLNNPCSLECMYDERFIEYSYIRS